MTAWIAISKPRLWWHRLPRLMAAGVCGAALGLIAVSIQANLAIADAGLVAASLACVLGGVAGIMMSLQVNRMGIFDKGFAPPSKPLNGILSEPWILPWNDLSEVEIIPGPLSRAGTRGGVTVRVVSSSRRMEWLLASDRLPRWFGDRKQAERFVAVLTQVGEGLHKRGSSLSSEEASRIVQGVSP